MGVRRSLGVYLALILTFWVTLTAPVLAGRSPSGMVDDRANLWSAEQLKALETRLANRPYRYQVVVLERAFGEDNPANKDERFRELARGFLDEYKVAGDTVLITIALRERLVDFRVWDDGAVGQAFRQATGREFGAYTGVLLERFGGPARQGDYAGATVAAADAVDQAAPPEPVKPSAQTQTPAQTHAQDAPSYLAWWLGGAAGVGVAGLWGYQAVRYRRRRKKALALRDGFLDQLLDLTERKLPLARNFDRAETCQLARAAAAASEESLHRHAAGDQHLREAERQVRTLRFRAANQALDQVERDFSAAADSCQSACESYAPIGEALRDWEQARSQGQVAQEKAQKDLAGGRSRTGWPFPLLERRLEEGARLLAESETARPEDPVRAVRLVREGEATSLSVSSDVAALFELQRAYTGQQQFRQRGLAEVAGGRQALGLRYVECDPEQALARALEHERQVERLLPEGDEKGARQALEAAAGAVNEALGIVSAYRQALEQYPVKIAELSRQLDSLAADIATAERLEAELSGRYAPEDWTDLANLPRDLISLAHCIREGLVQVERLTSPAEQRYLQAVELLGGWLNEREQIRPALLDLTGRPGQLDALARTAGQRLDTARAELQTAGQMAQRQDLQFPSGLTSRQADTGQRFHSAERLGAIRPLPAHRWDRLAQEALEAASAFRREVEALARQAADARRRLDQAHSLSHRSAQLSSYNRSQASRFTNSLDSGQLALTQGRYEEALAQAAAAIEAAEQVEASYQADIEGQERARRAEESRSSSGGSGSWDSSSDDRSSGGGGSWDSGNSNDDRSSGGGGSW